MEKGQGKAHKLTLDLTGLGFKVAPKSYGYIVVGDCMNGAGINNGDIIIFDPRPHQSGDIVVAVVNDQPMLKRYFVENGQYLLRHENPEYSDIVTTADLEVRGVAIGLIRRF